MGSAAEEESCTREKEGEDEEKEKEEEKNPLARAIKGLKGASALEEAALPLNGPPCHQLSSFLAKLSSRPVTPAKSDRPQDSAPQQENPPHVQSF